MKSKVAIVKCESYGTEIVYEAVKKAIDLLGGLAAFVPKQDKVLLKPNLLNKAAPEKAVTTHPAVFEAVIRLLREDGYENCFYGDSPGPPLPPEKVAETCGLKQAAQRYQLPFGDFQHGKTLKYPEGQFTKQFEMSNAVLEADSIINLCKMKTHALMRVTGAVKNHLGCVYAFNKAMSHSKFPDPEDFGKMLADLCGCVGAKLHIMDGIVAMEGNGPFSGDPVSMNVILASSDPVALDAVFCKLIDVDPLSVPTIKAGAEFGLGIYKDNEIELVGDTPLEGFINKNFRVSKDPLRSDKWQKLTLLRPFLIKKPIILNEKCVKCGACIEACPIKDENGKNSVQFKENIALFFKNQPEKSEKKEAPVYNYKNCIRCYCCQEMCPAKAIEVKTPFLGKLFIYK